MIITMLAIFIGISPHVWPSTAKLKPHVLMNPETDDQQD
jgi:hypothetical protein